MVEDVRHPKHLAVGLILQGHGADNRGGLEVVEDMEVTLTGRYTSHPIALEVVIQHLDTTNAPAIREVHLCVLTEVRRVRIEEHARVVEDLKHEFGGGHLVGKLQSFFTRLTNTQLEKGLECQPAILDCHCLSLC